MEYGMCFLLKNKLTIGKDDSISITIRKGWYRYGIADDMAVLNLEGDYHIAIPLDLFEGAFMHLDDDTLADMKKLVKLSAKNPDIAELVFGMMGVKL